MKQVLIVAGLLGLMGYAGAAPAQEEPAGAATSAAAEDANSEAVKEPKLPEPLTDEQVALIVEDEVDAVLLRWQSLSTNASIDLNTGQVRRNMGFNTHIVLTNDTRITHVGSQLFFTEALDQDGQQILPTRMDIVEKFGNTHSLPNTSWYPPQRDSNQPSPYRQVGGSIQNYERELEKLQKLRGFVPIRIAAQTVVIDQPLAKGTAFEELVPGLTFKVHEISESSSYHQPMVYFARPGSDPNQGIRAEDEPGIAKVEVLDATGEPIDSTYLNQGTTSIQEQGQRMYVFYQQPRIRKVPGRTPTTLRFHVALRLVEAPVWFEFEDVPLP